MSVKETLREIRKTIQEIIREINEVRRETQFTLHTLKVTPIRNILVDEINYRRPLHRIKRTFKGE